MSSDDIAISVRNLGKTYRLFGHPGDRIKQFFSLGMKKYHNEFIALNDVSFDIKKGETVGIIGRNGSGKSTLLQLICGILKPTTGSVDVNGRISALLELGAGFTPEFTGRENVYFQGAVMGISKEKMDARFDEIASFADIGEFIDQPVRTYSSGKFVRLAFATMIHADSDILIVDEALAVGDEAYQQKCFNKLSEYFEGNQKILLLVSHNTRQIERTCSRVIWLEHGRMAADGRSAEICNSYQINVLRQIKTEAFQSAQALSPYCVNSGVLDVKKVFLCAASGDVPVEEICMHSPVRVVIEFVCHMSIANPDIIVEFHTLDLVPIVAANIGRSYVGPNFASGGHRLECFFPEVILQSGVYQIKVVFLDRFRNFLWEGRKLCTFRVLPSPDVNVMRVPMSLVDVPFEWKVVS